MLPLLAGDTIRDRQSQMWSENTLHARSKSVPDRMRILDFYKPVSVKLGQASSVNLTKSSDIADRSANFVVLYGSVRVLYAAVVAVTRATCLLCICLSARIYHIADHPSAFNTIPELL
jgi:hypothetical protein